MGPQPPEKYTTIQFEGDNLITMAIAWLHAKARQYLPDDPDALPPVQESLL